MIFKGGQGISKPQKNQRKGKGKSYEIIMVIDHESFSIVKSCMIQKVILISRVDHAYQTYHKNFGQNPFHLAISDHHLKLNG